MVRDHDEDGSLRLTASSSFAGGSITFVALPERFPDKAEVRLFVLRPDATDQQHECAGDLWINGERVTPHEAAIEAVPGGALLTAMVASASECGAACACEAGAEGWCEVPELADLGPSQMRTVSALYDGVCDAVEFSLR